MATSIDNPCMCKSSNTDSVCKLSATSCCWCLDKRPIHMVAKFFDGLGMLGHEFIPIDIDYCVVCKKSEDTFSVLVSKLFENMTPSKRREIDQHIKDLAKRKMRCSEKYLESRKKFYVNL